eukprot:TRINITY_DN13380_c0_g1_i1.p2 TRINITY_DN13380_c0_g1~~TRINITY_DN13380_c0_g1_i1.p2  ORF type:complete len:130 (+),score=13.27 TRINITY_DN13380_c0_g1_i1:841-1230(+)
MPSMLAVLVMGDHLVISIFIVWSATVGFDHAFECETMSFAFGGFDIQPFVHSLRKRFSIQAVMWSSGVMLLRFWCQAKHRIVDGLRNFSLAASECTKESDRALVVSNIVTFLKSYGLLALGDDDTGTFR